MTNSREIDGIGIIQVGVTDGRYDIFGVYANGELANQYVYQEEAEMAVDDLLELGVDAELVLMSVII